MYVKKNPIDQKRVIFLNCENKIKEILNVSGGKKVLKRILEDIFKKHIMAFDITKSVNFSDQIPTVKNMSI